jgi:hypothetical protein
LGDVAHPGPEPALFSYPFAEARRARQALVDAAARITATVRIHELALPTAMDGFEGRTRHEFEPRLHALLDGCRAHAEALLVQADQLDHELAVAQRRLDASVEARARWRRDLARWTTAQHEAGVR